MLATAILLSPYAGVATAEEMPLFDAHIHYSHDAVKQVPPRQAAKILRDAGIRKALVSSSDDDGTQKLHEAAPDIVVPSLRPYRRRGETRTWVDDESVIAYIEDRLSRFKYKAIGEFHAYGSDIDKPVVQRMIALAKENGLLLHAHSDADAIDRIFSTWPGAKVLWAHSGFESAEEVGQMLGKHENLWSDLAFRSEHGSGGSVPANWRAVFEAFPERFMIGTDTFAPERWYYIKSHADFSRAWLKDLPQDLARNIGYSNAERMLEAVGQ
ncbi:amidohydrolase [Labrenzia sp. 011]|nr:amidohydrolase [Labrenzia sp. 011]